MIDLNKLMPAPARIFSLDLGQSQDFSALAYIERAYAPVGEPAMSPIFDEIKARNVETAHIPVTAEYHLRDLLRFPLNTSYVDVVQRVIEVIRPLGEEIILAVDATGVGTGVSDFLWEQLAKALTGTMTKVVRVPIVITGGDAVTRGPRGVFRVPKRDLASSALVAFQNKQLLIPKDLPLREELISELKNFRVKINLTTGHDSYEAWRERDHDDIVLAVSMGLWAGQRFLKKQHTVRVPELILADPPPSWG